MCMQHHRSCACGAHGAHLSFRDNILTPEILLNLYCPECSSQAEWQPHTMVADCGWILEFDLDGAQFCFLQRGLKILATPEVIFDEGYLSWQGFSPHDLQVNAALHQRLEPLSKQDMNRYLEALRTEWLKHVSGLKAAGWRKARHAV